MNSKGFMRLHRQLLDWEWFDNSQMVHVWIYFLLKANYQDSKWHGIDIPRGSFITSLDTICKDTGLSLQNVRTCMNKLKSTGEITTKVTNKYSIVTVSKYEIYNLQDSDTNKQINKQTNIPPTSNQQTINKQLTSDKESKEIEELKKENERLKEELANASKKKRGSAFVPPTVEEVRQYIIEKGFHFDASAFVSFYESKGWMVGKNKMKDWAAACRTWERNGYKDQSVSLFNNGMLPGQILQGNRAEKIKNAETWK